MSEIEEDFKNLSFIEKEEHSACDLEESIKSCYLAISTEFYKTDELLKKKLYKSKTKTNILKRSKFNIKKDNNKKDESKLNNKKIVKTETNKNSNEQKKLKSKKDLTNIQKKTISFRNKEKPQIIQKSKTTKSNNNNNNNNIFKNKNNTNKLSNKNNLNNTYKFNSNKNKNFLHAKTFTNNSLTKKEISQKKIDELKKKIFSIFEENNNLLKSLPIKLEKNDEDFSKLLSEAQITYENELEELYSNQIKLLNDIDNKYNKDIFELKNLLEEEVYKTTKEKESDIEALYLALKNDKENEINNINKIFDDKKNEIIKKYKNKIDSNDLSIDDRSVIIKNELFDNFINKIYDVIYPNKIKKKEKIENKDVIIEINNDELLV